MKKMVLFAVIGFCFLVFPVSVFASGKCEVTLVNSTGADISQVVINESGNAAEKPYYIAIEKDSSSELISLKKGVTYDIVLFDSKGHKYGRKRCKLLNDSARIVIKKTDFIPQGIGDVIAEIFNL
jgi:hypothetical protein